jgi:hypothetical protein
MKDHYSNFETGHFCFAKTGHYYIAMTGLASPGAGMGHINREFA